MSLDPVDLTSENALGEDFEGKPLVDVPANNWFSRFVSDVGTFFKGAYEGVRDESILGKVVSGTKKIVNDVTNTTALLPVVVLAVIFFLGLYLLAMGKKGKAVL